MDPREYELIALGHVLARYRIQGGLPNIEGKPFDLNDFKAKLFAGINPDTDVNINIENLKTENTIVEQCDEEHHIHTHGNVHVAAEVPEVNLDQNIPSEITATANINAANIQLPATESSTSTTTEKSSITGKLFQFFSKDD